MYLHLEISGGDKVAIISDTKREFLRKIAKKLVTAEIKKEVIHKLLNELTDNTDILKFAERAKEMLLITENHYFNIAQLKYKTSPPRGVISRFLEMLQTKGIDSLQKDFMNGKLSVVIQHAPRLFDGNSGDLARALYITASVISYEKYGSEDRISVDELLQVVEGIKNDTVRKMAEYLIMEISDNGTYGLREIPVYIDPST
ncbi:MAG: hypothetical protein QXL15_00865, partial [Candidatus Korarchaeota archaeon]